MIDQDSDGEVNPRDAGFIVARFCPLPLNGKVSNVAEGRPGLCGPVIPASCVLPARVFRTLRLPNLLGSAADK